MFDVAPTEFLLVAVVALLVIGPKELPRVMRTVGGWVGKARGVARQFRAGFDEMVRESELAEMEKKWRAENERIMREFPADAPPVAVDLSKPEQPHPNPVAGRPVPRTGLDLPGADQPATPEGEGLSSAR